MMVKIFYFVADLPIGYFIPDSSFDQDKFQMEISAVLFL
jgi:hypothetical protein